MHFTCSSGSGCCAAGYNCVSDAGVPACCPIGETCSGPISGCSDPTLVFCGSDYNFCCPAGVACGRDANGNSECGGVVVGNGNGEGNSTDTSTETSPDTSTDTSTPVVTSTPITSPQINTVLPTTTPTTHAGNGALTVFNSITASLLNGGSSTTSTHSSGAGQVVVQSGMLGVVALVTGAMIL